MSIENIEIVGKVIRYLALERNLDVNGLYEVCKKEQATYGCAVREGVNELAKQLRAELGTEEINGVICIHHAANPLCAWKAQHVLNLEAKLDLDAILEVKA